MPAPEGLVEIATEPRSAEDRKVMLAALVELATADPSFGFYVDHESGQIVLQGSDEHHLDEKLDILVAGRAIRLNIGAPQVRYRETISRRADIDFTHKRIPGPWAEFARVKLVFEPGEPGSGVVFESAIVGGAVPEEYVLGVEKGITSAKDEGLLAGFPLIDFKATLVDGAFHDVDSSARTFEIASRAAFKELREKGGPKLLEPVMAVAVAVPRDCLASIVGDLSGRRGEIVHQIEGMLDVELSVLVPLASMFGYADNLRRISNGLGRHHMRFSHYAEVPLPVEPDGLFPSDVGMRA